jgi:hypothetical protein
MKNKLCIKHAYLIIDNLKEGANSCQCSHHGMDILEASLQNMGWVGTSDIIVTVHLDYELMFKDCVSYFNIMTAMKLTGKEVWEGFDAAKANWIAESFHYLIVDAHHCVMGLQACWEAKLPELLCRVRYNLLQFCTCNNCFKLLFLLSGAKF